MLLKTHYVVNFVLLKEGKALLERNTSGFWKLPGGHVWSTENPVEAITREAQEELGIPVEIISEPQLFDMGRDAYSFPAPFATFCHTVKEDNGLKEPHKNIGLVYMVKSLDEPRPEESQEIKWFTQTELQKADIIIPVKTLCLKALKLLRNSENNF